ncbi:MAG: hypothetical protein WD554_02760 [Flavobacteriaceae bacterium]
MNRLKPILSALIFILIVGCSNENEAEIKDENLINEESIDKSLTDYAYDEALAYLSFYFDANLDLSNLAAYAETSDDWSNNVVLTEVILEGSSNVDGYVVIERDQGTLLYFAHYKRTENKIHLFDFIDNEDFLLGSSTNFMNIDLIDYIENDPPQSEERRFWGWSCGPSYEVSPGSGQYNRTCCYHIVWQEITESCDTFAVDNLPGTRPRIEGNF